MNLESAIYLGVAGLVMAAVAFTLGRRTGGSARELEMEAELSTARSEQARSEAEAERLRNELDAGRQEYDEYRLSVVDHFSGTSDLLRDLTGQYRSVYEHLTKGASMLCPEGFVGITEGLPPPQLTESQPDPEEALDTGAHDATSFDSELDEIASHEAEFSSAPEPDDSEQGSQGDSDTDTDTDTKFDSDKTLGVPAVPS